MRSKVILLGLTALCAGCSSIGQRGSVTIQGRGASILSQKGDQLMSTGVYARKDVTPDFAAGYHKGIEDAAWREYWSMQDQQAVPRQNASGSEGHVNYYPVTIPEGTDANGVIRASREVTVPITE